MLEYAMTCPGGVGNPFLHLRLGQVYFEVYFERGELDAAADELARAYMSEGRATFAEQDPKAAESMATCIDVSDEA